MPHPKKYDATTDHLLEQWDFLKLSMRSYDEGREHEAKRLAVTIRVLLSDQGGTSLMKQLGQRDEMEWFSVGAVDPNNLVPSQNLTSLRVTRTETGGTATYRHRDESDLLALPHGWVDFETYWTEPVIKDGRGIFFTRRNLVLMLANRDGGAHVGKLDTSERSLAGGTEFGWAFSVGDSVHEVHENPVPASVRTIAGEIDLTLRRNAALLHVEDSPLAVPVPADEGSAVDGNSFLMTGLTIRKTDPPA